MTVDQGARLFQLRFEVADPRREEQLALDQAFQDLHVDGGAPAGVLPCASGRTMKQLA